MENLESQIIKQCAPTLAGLKTANLFNYSYKDAKVLSWELKEIRHKLQDKGVYIECLKQSGKTVLLYVYRKNNLSKDLRGEGILSLLKEYGYESVETEYAISKLKKRIAEEKCFPHEIGVFLGYPIGDVREFIRNKGQNCLFCGVWKVYCDAGESLKKFERYKKCTQVYSKVFANGRNISQLTVSA